MSTVSRWVVPCHFTEENHKTDPIVFDLTDYLKTMLTNEVWNRKFSYGFGTALKNTNPINIQNAAIILFPCFISGLVDKKRISKLIQKHCGRLPTYLEIDSYEKWSHQMGCVIIETEYVDQTPNIPSKSDLTEEVLPHYEMEFIEKYHQHIAVHKEMASFLLATLHLTFPTENAMLRNENPVNDGFFQISSCGKTYACQVSTDAFMHQILIESSKLQSHVVPNMHGICSVWHYDLWPLNRYLKAVESDRLSIDNLLDLVYALEGLFDKNASADFVKSMCLLMLCSNKKDARAMKSLLDRAYQMRNDIVHGGLSYDPFDYVNLDGKNVLAQQVYWKMKTIVARMLIKAISKLLDNPEMKNLRFNTDDFIAKVFGR